MMFPFFIYVIFINIGWYFYVVKIQIGYYNIRFFVTNFQQYKKKIKKKWAGSGPIAWAGPNLALLHGLGRTWPKCMGWLLCT